MIVQITDYYEKLEIEIDRFINNYMKIALEDFHAKILDKIIGDHQCGFQCNQSTTDQKFCICQLHHHHSTP